MILFVNACVRKQSRTLVLAKKLLNSFDGEIKEVRLEEIEFPVVNEEFINHREALKNTGKYVILCLLLAGILQKQIELL